MDANYTAIPTGLPWYCLTREFGVDNGTDHFYTTSIDEANGAVANDGYSLATACGAGQWKAAGWLLPNGSGQTPLYRARAPYSQGRQGHLYTIARDEIQPPYVEEEGGPIGEVYTGGSTTVPKYAYPMYRGDITWGSGADVMVGHYYSTSSSFLTDAGYTLAASGEPYFWVLPARSTFAISGDGKQIVAGPRFASDATTTYEDGDIEMVNDQTAAWVRPRGISTWTFDKLEFLDANGSAIANPSMMTVDVGPGMLRLEDKDVSNSATASFTFAVYTKLPTGSFKIDPKVVNKPTQGSILQ